MPGESQTVVIAQFQSAEQARTAIRKAGLSGIDGDRIKLDRPPESTGPRRRGVDRKATKFVFRRTHLAGIGVGLVAGLVAFGIAMGLGTSATSAWIIAALTAIAAFIVGFLIAGMSAFPLTPAFSDTLEEGQGAVRVVVHAADDGEAAAAEEAMEAAGAAWVNRGS